MKLLFLPRAVTLSAMMLFAAAPVFAAQPASPSLAWLLARHDRAAESPGSAHAGRTSKTVYALQTSGMTGTLTEYDAPPHKTRVEMVLGPISQTSADDGHTSWEQDMNGHVRLLSGPELTEDRAAQSFTLEGYDPVRDGKRGSITLRPLREAGTGDYVLDLAPVGGTRQTIYLDPHTYLVSKMVAAKAGINAIIQIQAYKRVGGEAVPSQMLISYAGLPITVSAQLVSAQRGIPVSPTLFAPPVTPASDLTFLTASGQGPATFPYTETEGEITISVAVNGTPLHLLLDSGAGSSFLTGAAAKAAGLSLTGNVPAVGYGGAAKSGIATHASVEIPGAVRLPNETVYVIRDPSIAAALQQRGGADGALGYDLFSRFVVTIDYAAKTITLAKPADYVPPAGAMILPLRIDTRTPSISASVDGRPAARFLIDTGDNSAIHLYQAYARAHGLVPAPGAAGAEVGSGVGVGGTVQETMTPNHTLRIGTQTLTGVSAAVIGGGGITDVLHQAGGLGNAVLSHFRVTFDYAHYRLVLEPPTASDAQGAHAAPLFGFLMENELRAVTSLTIQELLQRHLQALGGKEAVSAITGTRVNADVITGGLHGTITTIYQSPKNEYEEDKIGILDITQGYNGKTAWRSDTNGNVRLLGPDEIQNLQNQLYFDTNSYVLPGPISGKITLKPQREKGTGDYILDALPEGGKPTTLFVNPRTYLIDKEQHLDDNVLVTTTYSDYHRVNGVEFPFAQHTSNGNKRYDISLKVKTLENNVSVPDALFQEPTEDSDAHFVTPGATSATVPFDFDDGEIGLQVSVNGHLGRVFLDSGSSGIAISKATADQLHLPESGYLEARGYGGSTDLLPVKIASLEVPDAVRLTNVAAVAIPLSQALTNFLQHPVLGFVGYDLLSHFVVRIDFQKRQVTFLAPQSFQPTAADGTAVPIALDNDIPTLTAQLDNLPPARYLVDTGDESDLRLYGPYVSKNNLNQKYPGGVATVGGGVGGASASRLTRVNSFTVAGITLRGVPADFSLDTKGGASEIEAGSLGVELLSRFNITFDYPHNRIYFAPVAGTTMPFETRITGLAVAQTGVPSRIVIAAVFPGSPAQFSDVRVGDQILSIDGDSVDNLGVQGVQRLLSTDNGKAAHTLVVRTGNQAARTITVPVFDPLTAQTAKP